MNYLSIFYPLLGLRKFILGNNGVEPTYEIMIEPVP